MREPTTKPPFFDDVMADVRRVERRKATGPVKTELEAERTLDPVSGDQRPAAPSTAKNGRWKELVALGVTKKPGDTGPEKDRKHIPAAYRTSSVRTRCELLAGLVDSDGHLDIRNSTMSITQSPLWHLDIVKHAAFLIRSLGFTCSVYHADEHRRTTDGRPVLRKYAASTLTFRPGNALPCLLRRKQCPPRQNRPSRLWGVRTASRLPPAEGYGFSLSGDGLFLNEDFVVLRTTVPHAVRLPGESSAPSSSSRPLSSSSSRPLSSSSIQPPIPSLFQSPVPLLRPPLSASLPNAVPIHPSPSTGAVTGRTPGSQLSAMNLRPQYTERGACAVTNWVPADGNCMFHAFANAYGTGITHVQVRQAAQEYLADNSEQFIQFWPWRREATSPRMSRPWDTRGSGETTGPSRCLPRDSRSNIR